MREFPIFIQVNEVLLLRYSIQVRENFSGIENRGWCQHGLGLWKTAAAAAKSTTGVAAATPAAAACPPPQNGAAAAAGVVVRPHFKAAQNSSSSSRCLHFGQVMMSAEGMPNIWNFTCALNFSNQNERKYWAVWQPLLPLPINRRQFEQISSDWGKCRENRATILKEEKHLISKNMRRRMMEFETILPIK